MRRTSPVNASAAEVWARVTSPDGINYELRPWMRMTMPRQLRGRAISEVSPGRLGRSWILLFGFLPFEYDNLNLVEIDPEGRFLERSSMLWMRAWEHERAVEPVGEGRCEVSDRIAFELRAPLAALGLSRPVAAVIRRLFERRHERLRRYYAG